MRRVILALAVMMLMISPAFGLSDSEYLRMRKSNADFANADKRLNQVWANLKKSLPKKIFSQLDKLQREWIASGRDDEANSYMSDGYSRMEAYTLATNDRADALPKIAKDLRDSRRQTQTPSPKPMRKIQTPAPKPATAPEPEPEPKPEPEPEPETLTLTQIEGEYQNASGFVSVRVTDINTGEVQVTFSRFKDGVHWTAKGWIDAETLELSDANYSECQATLRFSRGSVKVDITDTDDWNEAIAPDFVLEGTYKKQAM